MKATIVVALTIVSTMLVSCDTSLVRDGPFVVQGHVLEFLDREVLVDVGHDDGLTLGDVLVAYRVTQAHVKRSGAMRIDEFVGPHKARGTLVSGVVTTGEFVEFRGERRSNFMNPTNSGSATGGRIERLRPSNSHGVSSTIAPGSTSEADWLVAIRTNFWSKRSAQDLTIPAASKGPSE